MALDPRILDFFVAERGPFLYHGGEPKLQEKLLTEGLRPRALTGQAARDKGRSELGSRPGHVYLGSLGHLTRLQLTALIKVDLRLLDPALICCDEDAIWELGFQGDWQRLDEACRIEGCSTRWLHESMWRWRAAGASFGDWADSHAGLIDRSGVVALSLAYGSVAYQGEVPAAALAAV